MIRIISFCIRVIWQINRIGCKTLT